MKKLLLSVLCIISVTLFAQPQLTSDEMLGFGSVMEFSYADNYTIIDTNIQGAGVTWDLSDFDAISGNDFTMEIVDPATTSHGDDFPESNYAYKEDYGSTNYYRYFNLTSEKLERIGSFASGLNTFTNAQEEYVFPLELGVINIDSWDNTSSSFGGGEYNITCIGYGTLILPDITFTDALMVRAYITEGDLIEIFAYFWYSADNGAILLSYYDGDGFFVGDAAIYLIGLDETVPVNSIYNVTEIKYNNPVNDYLHLRFNTSVISTVRYSIINITGETVLKGNYTTNGTYEAMDIAVSKLPQGLYHLILSDENEKINFQTLKILKI
ncbi:MAG: T9SS type A sorting domain-containing protein [Fimbriimonadaceae bacterium]|nr:T9SS type A sorting domain-containing protein [Chitinophagales bacterium]